MLNGLMVHSGPLCGGPSLSPWISCSVDPEDVSVQPVTAARSWLLDFSLKKVDSGPQVYPLGWFHFVPVLDLLVRWTVEAGVSH